MYEPVRISRIEEGETLFIVAEGKYSLTEVQTAISEAIKESKGIRDCCLHMDIRRYGSRLFVRRAPLLCQVPGLVACPHRQACRMGSFSGSQIRAG